MYHYNYSMEFNAIYVLGVDDMLEHTQNMLAEWLGSPNGGQVFIESRVADLHI